jgi:hypothetical protein
MSVPIKGLETRRKLKQHLTELEEEAPAQDPPVRPLQSDPIREIAALRKEVAELRNRLSAIREQTDGVPSQSVDHPWLRIFGTAAATFLLGKLMQRFGLGAAGAAAVPLIVAQANGRIW